MAAVENVLIQRHRMSYTVLLERSASADVAAIYKWYKKQSPAAAANFENPFLRHLICLQGRKSVIEMYTAILSS